MGRHAGGSLVRARVMQQPAEWRPIAGPCCSPGGASTEQVAATLGDESVPGFVTSFETRLGTSPGRYMADRRAGWL